MESFFPMCQRDSYCKRIEAEVISCEPHKPQQQQQQKQKKNNKAGSNGDKKGSTAACAEPTLYYDVILSDTVLFAEAGGQPCDYGTVGGHPCKSVQVGSAGNVHVHTIDAPLAVGARVVVEVDWPRRFEHMQQHTSQHILTALAARDFAVKTVGWALHEDRTIVEFEDPDNSGGGCGAVTQELIDKLEAAANEVIREARPVYATVYAPDAVPEDIRSRGSIPTDGSPIRVVTVTGVDSATCCGTHVANTADLQAIKVVGTERARQGTIRLAFLAGEKVLRTMGFQVARERAVGKLLCCQADAFAGRIEGLMEENAALAKQRKRLVADIADLDAQAIVSRFGRAQQQPQMLDHHRSSVGMDYLEALAAAVAEKHAEHEHEHEPNTTLFVFTASDGPVCEGPGSFLLIGPADTVQAAGKVAREILSGKGGGKGGKFQGKADHMEKREEFMMKLAEMLNK